MKRILLLLGIFLIGAILWACTPKDIPVEKATSLEFQPQASAKEAWELKWERTLQVARKEGRVVVYGGSTVAGLKLHATKLFKEKFGLDLEALSGRGSDVVAKMLSERRAGLFTVDVYISGPTSIYTHFKPMGALDPIEPALILPEVIDPNGWLDGKHYLGDEDRLVYLWAASPEPHVVINTTVVQPEEIKSYQDLLSPKWKGKIMINDPSLEGPGRRGFVDAIYHKFVEPDFFRQLVKYQDVAVSRDDNVMITWLVRGKYPIVLWPNNGRLPEYIEAGAPIDSVTQKEGISIRAGGAALILMNRAPNPNAAIVFTNWFLSREGQTLAQIVTNKQSRRVDISTEVLPHVRQPGVKYFASPSDEEVFTLQEHDKYVSLAREIFGPLLR